MKTPYDVLGISLDADEKTIAIAFREAAKHCHPDLNPGHHASKRFKEISGARDALRNPAWRALYQYVQLRRQHDRRQWIVTIASCIISAVVSGGLVNFLQKSPMPDPQIMAAPLSAEGRSLHGLELADTSADVGRRENDTPLQSVAIQREASGLQHVENEPTGSAQDRGLVEFPVLGMAQWPSQQARAAVEEDAHERGGSATASKEQSFDGCRERLDNRSEQLDGNRCLEPWSQSKHHSAAARHSTGHNHDPRNSLAIHKPHRRFTDRRISFSRYRLTKRGSSYLRRSLRTGQQTATAAQASIEGAALMQRSGPVLTKGSPPALGDAPRGGPQGVLDEMADACAAAAAEVDYHSGGLSTLRGTVRQTRISSSVYSIGSQTRPERFPCCGGRVSS